MINNLDIKKLHLYNSYFDIEKFNVPYQNNQQYLDDLRYLVDAYVNALFRIKKSNSREKAKYFGLRGIVITDDEVDNSVMSSMLENRNVKVGEDIKQSLIVCFEHINNRLVLSESLSDCFKLENFFKNNDCNFFTKLAVIFSLVSEMDRKYERIFGYLQDDNTVKKPTVGLVFSAASLTQDVDLRYAFDLLDNKLTVLIFDDITSYELPSFISKGLKLKKLAVDFFMNNKAESFMQNTICSTFYPSEEVDEIIVNKDVCNNLILETCKILEKTNKNKNIIHLYGPAGVGKRFHVKHLAKALNKSVLFVNLKYIMQFDNKVFILLSNVYLSAFLNDSLLCFYNCDFDVGLQSGLEFILNDVFRIFNIVFLLNENSKYFEESMNDFLPVVDFKFDYPTVLDSAKIWKFVSTNYNIADDVNFKQISNRFKYTFGQIKDILFRADLESVSNNNIISNNILIKTCREFAVHNLDKRASLINCSFTFKDLVLDEEQKEILVNACNYIKFKDVIYEDWGFKEKVQYGRGLSVLMYGPPGTGKTMGAQVMANELGLQLYKVDLSQIINKYIGETEKNLNDIFTEAKKSNAIILFDEADSLFGKRTDVKDSNDKNANNETSYLLQKMEEYDGVSILTTNKFNNFDDAFRRRIKFVVSFPMPDFNMRKELWQKVFPSKAPIAEDFDPWFLAENFEISGSNIKSIAVYASYLAASEQSNITMKHILKALKYELQKSGKIISKQDFGIYSDRFENS